MTEEQKKDIENQMMVAAMNDDTNTIIDLLSKIPSIYLSYDARKTFKANPKSTEKLRKFLVENSNDNKLELTDEELQMVVFMNPRILYDFFDSQKIIISIDYDETVDLFRSKIQYPGGTTGFESADDGRHACEIGSFTMAFETLESLNG